MANKLTVAAIQMISSTNLVDNLRAAERLIKNAADQGAAVVALPEYFCLMGLADTDKVKVREPFGRGPIQDALQGFAQKYHVFLIAGTIPLEASDPLKVLNASLVFNPEGQCIARYDKIHLFGFQTSHERYQESETIEAGSQPTTVRILHEGNEWVFVLSIFYDIRFPEFYL